VSKMNGPTRKKRYKYLGKRDGELCKRCHVSSSEKQLVIDHIDNNNSNNLPENLQLLCRSCNYLKNPRRPVDMCVSENISEIPSELEVNRTKEPEFKQLIAHFINENGMWEENDLKNSTAEQLELSPVTTKRYLDKVCSSEGIYRRIKPYSKTLITYKTELDYV